ncbi:acyl-CoA dehydrogenase family protein [Spirosoma validum]|uniref:Acyl-CoA dehydrogenase n=1 Tax=Spirosoma validum TaxID=2771355 RepID=A0A927B8K3_9BACT|nr:acyl-CoA dehydrogenase [Spirosoma validum]MBD2757258.1 acyl-CoA dehydrogenase [Spirosoma validum]
MNNSWSLLINELAGHSEQMGQLHPQLIKLIYTKQWFKLYLLPDWGGVKIEFPATLRLLKTIAQAESSTRWVVPLCSGASWFAGFWDTNQVRRVFLRPDTCITGSDALSETAIQTGTGYIVNGFWKHGTGALHATHFTASCLLKNPDGSPVYSQSGQELVRSFLSTKEEVKLVPTWATVAMTATGSHGFEVNHLAVMPERSFVINEALKRETNVANCPFLQLSETTLAVNFSGMATHFFDLLHHHFFVQKGIDRFARRQAAWFHQEYTQQNSEFNTCQQAFYQIVDESWQEQGQQNYLSEQTSRQVSQVSIQLAHTFRRVIDQLFPYCGSRSARS